MHRLLVSNKTEIALFFRNLQELTEKKSYPAEKIFNVDKTVITTRKIYAPKGVKQVKNVSVYLTHIYIYPTKNQAKIGGPIGEYECTKSGWNF